jgi:myosin heavy subunit
VVTPPWSLTTQPISKVWATCHRSLSNYSPLYLLLKAFCSSHSHIIIPLAQLIHLEKKDVLRNLLVRYERNEIYSSISKVLLAVNPYRELAVYDDATIRRYRKHAEEQFASAIVTHPLPPHVYSISQMSYLSLLRSNENQSIIVCGESGSGKTESAKHLLRYLAFAPEGTSSLAASLQAKIIAANPILEAFGNAKTVLNENSSRCVPNAITQIHSSC